MPRPAQAASTADATEPIDTAQSCTLTLLYRCDGTAVPDLQVRLYHIADVSADFQYTPTAPFRSAGLGLNGVQSAGEWNVIRSTLESRILADSIAPLSTAVTDPTGQVCFDDLAPGLYLVPDVRTAICSFDSALIAIPGLNPDGRWQYSLTVTPKPEITPPGPGPSPDPGPTPDPGTKLQFKVLKLWKGDSGQDRPQSVEVELFRDGVSHQTVTLSEENHWSYSWTTEDDRADWMVVERNVPTGYTVTVEERTDAFILTNTWQPEDIPPDEPPTVDPPSPDDPDVEDVFSEVDVPTVTPPSDSPKTGDTPHIMFYTILMYVSGGILILLGITGKRKDV